MSLDWKDTVSTPQAKKHISPKLVAKALEVGIVLKVLDPEQSLEGQEPFSVVLHKIRDAGKLISPSFSYRIDI